MKIDSSAPRETVSMATRSSTYNSKNGIFKRNSPMSELVVVENERKKNRKIKNSYFIQVVTLFGGSFAFETSYKVERDG